MPTPKKTFKRVEDKQYTFVDVTVSYCATPMTVPSIRQVPGAVGEAMEQGDRGPLREFLKKYADPGLAEFLFDGDLDGDEQGEFLTAWQKESGLNAGK